MNNRVENFIEKKNEPNLEDFLGQSLYLPAVFLGTASDPENHWDLKKSEVDGHGANITELS
ncbi:MAG: hypothetical protein ACRD5H_15735 [Nitrososphaerales archaeon]